MDDLVQALGIVGISKSDTAQRAPARLCATLDAEVERFRTRPLTGRYPYVWLDATYLKVRQNGRVVSMAVVIAIGVTAEGRREVLGLDVGPSEEEAFWQQFLRGLVERGLTGVQLVTSDAHAGLKRALTTALQGASWQRCRVHFVRNALALVPKSAQQLVAATIRTVFAQPGCPLGRTASAREQWRRVADNFRERFPRLANLMDDAEADVLAYLAFPSAHWRQIWSNNPLERLNKEVKRRSGCPLGRIVGIFPNDAAVIRLVGAILAEQHDEWQVSRCSFSAESLTAVTQCEPTPERLSLLAVR